MLLFCSCFVIDSFLLCSSAALAMYMLFACVVLALPMLCPCSVHAMRLLCVRPAPALLLLCGCYVLALLLICSCYDLALFLLCSCSDLALLLFCSCSALVLFLLCPCSVLAMLLICSCYYRALFLIPYPHILARGPLAKAMGSARVGSNPTGADISESRRASQSLPRFFVARARIINPAPPSRNLRVRSEAGDNMGASAAGGMFVLRMGARPAHPPTHTRSNNQQHNGAFALYWGAPSSEISFAPTLHSADCTSRGRHLRVWVCFASVLLRGRL